jgi:glutamyl-tRNA reductase
MRIVVHGLNHRTAPIDVRERAAFLPDEAAEAARQLLRENAAAEVVILSTCNRTEFYGVTDDPEALVARQRELMRQHKGIDPEPGSLAYVHTRRAGAEHLFRVAGGIDSMVIGENGIVAQLKTAFEEAEKAGTLGPLFRKLFPAALRMAKRARTETGIAQGAVSLEKAGLMLARKVYSTLGKRHALVVGAGVTGMRLALRLHEEGVGGITIANRTLSRAQDLAAQVGGKAVDLDGLPGALEHADLLLTAAHVPQPLITSRILGAAMTGKRKGRPILVIDLGIPRNVDAECADLEGVFLYAVDDLQELVEINLGKWRAQIPAVEAIVREETDRYREWLVALDVAPVVVALREHTEELRRESVERFGKSLSAKERERLERFSKTLMNKLLHAPTVSVRGCDASTSLGRTQLDWTRHLFAIDGDEPEEGDDPS